MTTLQRGAVAARSRRHALATELLAMWRAERAHWSTLTA